jgi:hypothetical protein
MLTLILSLTAALPPITTTTEALAVLKSANKVEALNALKDACRGKFRRELRDKPQLQAQLASLFSAGPAEVKKAVLDTSPCFSSFTALIESALKDPDDAVVAYGAEVSARLEDPALVALLHRTMEPRKTACLGADLSNSAADVCIWLTYAPGACLGNADEATRTAAGEQATEMLKAHHPKIREVATETLAATRLAKFAPKKSKKN